MFIYFFPFFAERNIGIIVIYRRKSRFSYHSRSETKLIFEAIYPRFEISRGRSVSQSVSNLAFLRYLRDLRIPDKISLV